MASGFESIAPAGSAWAVTPSDSTVFTQKTRALWVGTGGNIAVRAYDMNGALASVTLTNVADGQIVPVCTDMVYSTNTTASGIVALA